jgi:site-specific DNA-cytosine methylase
MKPRVVSLFCGLGGWDLGLYRAAQELGIEVEVVAAYDSWPKAVEVYNANLPHPVAQVRDLKAMQRDELPPHDLVIGGPPCQPFSMAGKRQGHSDERNCLPDFLRLVGDSPYVMENVVPRLINAPWSERLCAADFGDVTSRKRWFYSNYLFHVIPTPGPRRIRDIQDHAEDERVLKKRGYWTGDEMQAVVEDGDVRATLCASDFHGTKNNGSGKPTKGSKIACKAGNHGHYDSLDSLSAHSWHGHDIRGSGKLVAIAEEDDRFGTLTATSNHRQMNGSAPRRLLRLGLRGNSASAFEDDEILGSVLSNSFHANEASRIVACRNPSLLEMARAHSIPDSFDWRGATKTDRGKMIANSIPVGMSTAVSSAILRALVAERQIA